MMKETNNLEKYRYKSEKYKDINIYRCVNHNYHTPKQEKELEKLNPNLYKHKSQKVGKYHYSVNRVSVIRFVPLSNYGTKNWLFKDKAKLTPYYEILIGNHLTPTFWHLSQAVEFIIKYKKGQVDEYYYKDEYEDHEDY